MRTHFPRPIQRNRGRTQSDRVSVEEFRTTVLSLTIKPPLRQSFGATHRRMLTHVASDVFGLPERGSSVEPCMACRNNRPTCLLGLPARCAIYSAVLVGALLVRFGSVSVVIMIGIGMSRIASDVFLPNGKADSTEEVFPPRQVRAKRP